jgi:hypothetical protein
MRYLLIKSLVIVSLILGSPWESRRFISDPQGVSNSKRGVQSSQLKITFELQQIFLQDNFPQDNPVQISSIAFRVNDTEVISHRLLSLQHSFYA